MVGVINFPALLGLMVVSNNLYRWSLVKWNSIIPVLQLLCVVGAAALGGEPDWFAADGETRRSISALNSTYSKPFCLFRRLLLVGRWRAQSASRLASLLVQIINTILSYFVMIKPVLGSSYRQYILSLWLPFYLAADTGDQLCAGHCTERANGSGHAAGGANSRGRAGVCGDDCAVAPSAGGGSEASVLSQRKMKMLLRAG
ncbi:hypothetical protein OIU92_00835 [Escherichia coli]|nr:hypothetical protein [Escherichia coli]